MKSEAVRALDLTDCKSLLTLQRVGLDSEAESLHFHERKRGQSYNIHPYTPMAVDGYPRDRCEAEFGVGRFAGAMAKTIDLPFASLRKLRTAC